MMNSDLQLLRRFEPEMRYTQGEQFLPMDVESYVRRCGLWSRRRSEEPRCLIPAGKLTLERLAVPHPGDFETVHYLKFIDPLNVSQMAAYRLKRSREKGGEGRGFRAGVGRLARVGYLSRLGDTLFSLTLLARGRVSGDTAAAASLAYDDILQEDGRHRYYARASRGEDWTVLQYWFFYPFNNWRSGFYGVNDHEADWEKIFVYLSESEGVARPEWVAYSSHEYSGDDLRRRWDDPELEKSGEHPVVYVGAGSHAAYYRPGEYLAEINLPFLAPVARLANSLGRLRRRLVRRSSGDASSQWHLRVPFVDYARGDGFSIGAGGDREWDEPCVMDPAPAWATEYRGLWGLYARDPVSGEDAPAGPLYNRDGTRRRAWYDPVGWAGLDKVSPSLETFERVAERRESLANECAALQAEISSKSRTLTGLGVEADAMRGHSHFKKLYREHEQKMRSLSEELDALRSRLASDFALLEALDEHEERLRAGERPPVRAHIRRADEPASEEKLRLNRLAEVWAAVSTGLMMICLVGFTLFARQYLAFGMVALISLIVFIESGFQRRLTGLVNSVTVGLAVVAALILLYEFFWPLVILAVLAAGSYMVWENLRELWT